MAELNDALERIRASARAHSRQPSRGGPEKPPVVPIAESSEAAQAAEREERKFAAASTHGVPLVETPGDDEADLVVLVALSSPELNQALRVLGDNWRKVSRDGVLYNVSLRGIGGHELRIVAAVQNDMGLVPAAILATKAVRAWRPAVVAMIGICAGVKGKVELGDIVVGKQIFDYGSGKLIEGRLHPDYQPVALDEHLSACAQDLARDGALLGQIRAEWPLETGLPVTELRAHVGAIASGAAVVADDAVIEGIRDHKRGLLAIDMEAYGVARGSLAAIAPPRPLVIKGVQDFADEGKSDDYREYAAYVSARFLLAYIERYWGQLSGLE